MLTLAEPGGAGPLLDLPRELVGVEERVRARRLHAHHQARGQRPRRLLRPPDAADLAHAARDGAARAGGGRLPGRRPVLGGRVGPLPGGARSTRPRRRCSATSSRPATAWPAPRRPTGARAAATARGGRVSAVAVAVPGPARRPAPAARPRRRAGLRRRLGRRRRRRRRRPSSPTSTPAPRAGRPSSRRCTSSPAWSTRSTCSRAPRPSPPCGARASAPARRWSTSAAARATCWPTCAPSGRAPPLAGVNAEASGLPGGPRRRARRRPLPRQRDRPALRRRDGRRPGGPQPARAPARRRARRWPSSPACCGPAGGPWSSCPPTRASTTTTTPTCATSGATAGDELAGQGPRGGPGAGGADRRRQRGLPGLLGREDAQPAPPARARRGRGAGGARHRPLVGVAARARRVPPRGRAAAPGRPAAARHPPRPRAGAAGVTAYLVTGGAGFIGSHVTRRLADDPAARGHRLRQPHLGPRRAPRRRARRRPRARSCSGDLKDLDAAGRRDGGRRPRLPLRRQPRHRQGDGRPLGQLLGGHLPHQQRPRGDAARRRAAAHLRVGQRRLRRRRRPAGARGPARCGRSRPTAPPSSAARP